MVSPADSLPPDRSRSSAVGFVGPASFVKIAGDFLEALARSSFELTLTFNLLRVSLRRIYRFDFLVAVNESLI